MRPCARISQAAASGSVKTACSSVTLSGTRWRLCSGSQPYGIAIGSDGRIWYDESGKNDIVAFDPVTERTETVAIPTRVAVVRNMAGDSIRGRLWVAPRRPPQLGENGRRRGRGRRGGTAWRG